VAATKTFVCQVACVLSAGAALASCARRSSRSASRSSSQAPGDAAARRGVAPRVHPEVEAIAEWCWKAPFFLYIGRQASMRSRSREPEAQGDLLHLDGRLRGRRDEARTDRAAGRADAGGLCGHVSAVLGRSNKHPEVRARGAKVIAITPRRHDDRPHADASIAVPATDELLAPLLLGIPLQLLAIRCAPARPERRQPRNLAKTVTVE